MRERSSWASAESTTGWQHQQFGQLGNSVGRS